MSDTACHYPYLKSLGSYGISKTCYYAGLKKRYNPSLDETIGKPNL